MKELNFSVCEMGGYEVLLRGNGNDARRAIEMNVGDHPRVPTNGVFDLLLMRLKFQWDTGAMWWGPGLGKIPTLRWFARNWGKPITRRLGGQEVVLNDLVIDALIKQGVL